MVKKRNKKDILRVDCKSIFPDGGIHQRIADRDTTSATIVARCSKHGRIPAAKHAKRLADYVKGTP